MPSHAISGDLRKFCMNSVEARPSFGTPSSPCRSATAIASASPLSTISPISTLVTPFESTWSLAPPRAVSSLSSFSTV